MSAASVAAFRVAFGLLIAFSSARFLAKGWVDELWLQPEHHLTYWFADGIRPLPGIGMHLVLIAMALAGVALAVGYRSRVAAATFLVLFVYTELIDAALYLNHYWFVTLAALLMLVLPVHGMFSIDVRSGRRRARVIVPAWTTWLLRFQVAVVYVFAGLAKLNPDWLASGQPLAHWLPTFSSVPLVGPLLGERWVALGASWAGAVFDCTIVAWLLWRRSRPIAYVVVVAFHAITWLMFPIGVFPWVMIAAVTVFFPPDWPLALRERLAGRPPSGIRNTVNSAEASRTEASRTETPLARMSRPVAAALCIFVALQVLVPMRHLTYPSNVRWSDEGYYLSWRVMLTDKAGSLRFEVLDPLEGRIWRVDAADMLTEWQLRQASTRSDLVVATAHLVAEQFEERGVRGVEVRADSWVSFNGERRQRFIDPTVDLAAESRSPSVREWIVPLVTGS